jgi:hypothetical protein
LGGILRPINCGLSPPNAYNVAKSPAIAYNVAAIFARSPFDFPEPHHSKEHRLTTGGSSNRRET